MSIPPITDHYAYGNVKVHTELDVEEEQFIAGFVVPLDSTDTPEEGRARYDEFVEALRALADSYERNGIEFDAERAAQAEQHADSEPHDTDEGEVEREAHRPAVEEQKQVITEIITSFVNAWTGVNPDVPLAITANTDEFGATITSWDGDDVDSMDPRPLRMAGNALLELADQVDTSVHPEND